MKEPDFMFVLTADQVGSRTEADRVPVALAALDGLEVVLAFERTAGDELQGLCASPASVVEAAVRLTRLDGWRIGIGLGRVDAPLPTSTRAARGDAYLAARQAVAEARHSPVGLALALPASVGADGYGEVNQAARDAETALWLLLSTLARRSTEGWELMDLLDQGLTNTRAAAALGISPSAVSQRRARAARVEAARGAELAARLLGRVQQAGSSAEATP